jgi:hypothetical protein
MQKIIVGLILVLTCFSTYGQSKTIDVYVPEGIVEYTLPNWLYMLPDDAFNFDFKQRCIALITDSVPNDIFLAYKSNGNYAILDLDDNNQLEYIMCEGTLEELANFVLETFCKKY